MLEWYRPGYSLAALIDETATLVATILPRFHGPVVHYAYRRLFHTHLAVDPFTSSLETLRRWLPSTAKCPPRHWRATGVTPAWIC